jgi:hypothetical protein
MASGPRELLEHRIVELSSELELLFEGAREQARREQAEELNQAVRRLRIAPDADELCATLADAAVRLASGAILFRVAEGTASSDRIEVPLGDAPALAAAAESQDPLIAAAIPGELSAPLVELLAHPPDARISIFPVLAGERAAALLYCWGTVRVAALELLAQAASAVWSALPVPAPIPAPIPAPQLVNIAVAADPAPVQAKPAAAWEQLPPAEQKIHLRAQRFARVQAAEMRLYHAEVVQVGRSRRNLYEALRQPIEDARQAFRTRFFAGCPSMVDYLHLELTRTLANDDPDLLGSTYPGPLV